MIETLCTNPVAIFAVTTTTNASGDDLRPTVAQLQAAGLGTAFMASVQQGSVRYAADLAASQGIQEGSAGFAVYFAAEPVDATSARANKRLAARDLIAWTTASGDVRVLCVAGDVRDEGGMGLGWCADCIEVA